MRQQIRQYAGSPFPVLIEGESGSGKELVAASLHGQSPRAAKPYLALNCAAISPNLVEATLFGYAKGAFTGASASRAGYFEDARDGTLFLDEIGELPLELQAKLLRVLENGEYQRVGETNTRVSQARILAATNRDLKAEVQAGRFRADLYHRLSVFTLAVPPLRDLGEDKRRCCSTSPTSTPASTASAPFLLDDKSERAWMEYTFPGNVRELRNIVIRLSAKYAGRAGKQRAAHRRAGPRKPRRGRLARAGRGARFSRFGGGGQTRFADRSATSVSTRPCSGGSAATWRRRWR